MKYEQRLHSKEMQKFSFLQLTIYPTEIKYINKDDETFKFSSKFIKKQKDYRSFLDLSQ